ncbi:MAG: acetate--CoA ligase family protein [Candidatus Moranbacteria bacterium]|nr:acetate--CoA ligase family protein [Candidatus Moranbacteria bacterium]
MNKLEKFFNPQSIAIVGATEEAGKVGNILTKNLLELGYAGEALNHSVQGKIFLVNPKHEKLFGQKCYKNLSEIEKPVDLAIVAIPAKFVSEAVKTGIDKTKNFIIISAGFSEIGAEGKVREKELAEIAAQNNLNILGPNCLGFIIPALKLNASFAAGLPPEGDIAFVSQSGALISATLDLAVKENLRFSKIISIGNKMQMDEAEIMEYLAKDEETKVIALYLEGISDGKKFIETCQKISKPIVILKAGRTERSQKAIASHTGALAGSDLIMDAVFRKCGVIRAENLGEFFNLLEMLSRGKIPPNNSVAIVTNAGGPGVLTTDAFKNQKIQLAEFSDDLKRELKSVLPPESSVENPIDLLGDAGMERYDKVLGILGQNESIGSIIFVLTPQALTPVEKIADRIIEFGKNTAKNVTTVFIGYDQVSGSIQKMEASGLPNFLCPEEAVKALNGTRSMEHITHNTEQNINSGRREETGKILQKALDENRKALFFAEAKNIVEKYGIPTINFWTAADETVQFPAAVKVDSDKVLHKTDKQGLILDIKDKISLDEAVSKLKNNFPGENIIIQPMLPRDVELIVGLKRDPVFGPVIVAGLGGIYTEIFQIAELIVAPAGKEDIKNILLNGKLGFLFQATRGKKPYPLEKIIEIISGVQELAMESENIQEVDINPLLIYNNEKDPVAVDIKIII